jgi:putative ABC transport system substrate-binding protein
MSELGWVEGKTVQYTLRFDEDDKSKLPKLAAELAALHVDVLASTSVATPAARTATTTIPIVAMDTYDPVEEGLTPSLGTPIGNVTGASGQSGESAAKRVELAHDLIPHLQRIALITDPGDIGATIDAKSSRTAAARLGLDLRAFEVHHARDYSAAFAAIKRYRPQALMVTTSTLTIDNLKQTASFASSSRLPAFSEYSSFAEAGFLLTYGVGYVHLFKLAAMQVDRILKGAQPASLPWEQPTEFELVVTRRLRRH